MRAMTNTSSNTIYESPYMRPRQKKRWTKSIRNDIWNPETHEFLGRTAKSWGGILIFYAIFFSALAALFAICMNGMLLTLDAKRPKFLLDDGIIGSNPGLGFRPLLDNANTGALIWYQAANQSNYKQWIGQLDKFLEPYKIAQKLPGGGRNQQQCDFDRLPDPGKVCAVDVKQFQNCSSEMSYGYDRSSPCVFVKLNKIFDWLPEYYDHPLDLPHDMPLKLKEHIRDLYDKDPMQIKQVWVSCKGESPADREHLGPITYFPRPGFPGYYYPYRNIDGYLSPLVAIKLLKPKLNVLINIECRAWAKNIIYSNTIGHREGSVHFEVMID